MDDDDDYYYNQKNKPNTSHLLCILPHAINIYQQDFLLNPFFYAFLRIDYDWTFFNDRMSSLRLYHRYVPSNINNIKSLVAVTSRSFDQILLFGPVFCIGMAEMRFSTLMAYFPANWM